MRLRSQLALSHLKVLLAFVVIHLLLFVAATRFSDRSEGSGSTTLEKLRTRVQSAADINELHSLTRGFAEKERVVVEVKSDEGVELIGGRRLNGSVHPQQIVWQKNGQHVVLTIRGRGGPPGNPIVHVLITTLLAGIFGIFLAFRFSKAVSDPLGDLLKATQQMESGQDDATALLAHTKGPQEVENLARSFARMSETLSANLKKLKQERDRAEASEVSRRQLIADVSHNLRTPMAAAIGWLDSLIDGLVDDPEPCLRQIRRETLWASQRLERLLHLSRWEHAEPMMTFRSIALSDIVLEVAENLEERAVEKNLALDLQIEPGLKVLADRHHLRDLIQILLENIIEHSGRDRQATVQARCQDAEVCVVVKDDGPGLGPDFLSSWVGEPIVAKTGRVSLGLAIARRLARAHGSELRLSNRKDRSGMVARFNLERTGVEPL